MEVPNAITKPGPATLNALRRQQITPVNGLRDEPILGPLRGLSDPGILQTIRTGVTATARHRSTRPLQHATHPAVVTAEVERIVAEK